MIRYCLPIIERDGSLVPALIERERERYHYFEIWLDYIEDLDLDFVRELCASLGGRGIFLFRRKELEKIRLPVGVRFQIMAEIEAAGAYLDLDLAAQAEELEYLRKSKAKIRTILSYHNYAETPDWPTLRKLGVTMRRNGAEICKASCMCNSPDDAVRLLNLLIELKSGGARYIVLGMGKHGAVTRIFGTLWGNEMVFAPLSREAQSAPGQLARAELEEVFGILRR